MTAVFRFEMARRAGALVRRAGGGRPEGIFRRRVSPTGREDARRQRRTAPKTHGAKDAQRQRRAAPSRPPPSFPSVPSVIPAEAGIQRSLRQIPAFAGMTSLSISHSSPLTGGRRGGGGWLGHVLDRRRNPRWEVMLPSGGRGRRRVPARCAGQCPGARVAADPPPGLPPARGEEYEWVSPWQEEEGACPCGSGGVAGVFRFAGWPAGGGARPARGRRTSRGDIPSVPSVIPAEAGIQGLLE